MRICHVTPHLPPDQAANALLPLHLGRWASNAGHDVLYIAHPPVNQTKLTASAEGYGPPSPRLRRGPAEALAEADESRRSALRARRRTLRPTTDGSQADSPTTDPSQTNRALPGPVTILPRRSKAPAWLRKAYSLVEARRISRAIEPIVRSADLVHVHSNGLLSESAAVVAARRGKRVVMTLYGTEIWHYRPRRGVDLFTRAYFAASAVTFYSQALLTRAADLGLSHPRAEVIYPPVASEFRPVPPDERGRIRAELGVAPESPLLINVKRLHPLGGHRHLIDAMVRVQTAVPAVRLIICGTGPLRHSLEAQVRERRLDGSVQFAGLVDNRTIASYDAAADLFILPSLLEACPTVALEALACGTPVVSSDNPGGVELRGLFGEDIRVVPRENPDALAAAIIDALRVRLRVSPETTRLIEQEFRIDSIAARYFDVYRQT